MRVFSRQELSFFSVQRRWLPEIVARFGDDPTVRDAIMLFDSDGGLGLLIWVTNEASWVLTDKGRRWVGLRGCIVGAKWQPDPVERVRLERAIKRMVKEADDEAMIDEPDTDPRGSVEEAGEEEGPCEEESCS